MEDIQEKYNHLLQQNEALRQENEELKLLLHAHGIEYKPKRSIVVSSPKLYRIEHNVLVNQLNELAHIGIEVLIITTASNPETEHLLQRGLSVRILPEVKLCTTIIDKDIVWYGAINALGYATEEDNVIKVVDNKLANELLEVLLTS